MEYEAGKTEGSGFEGRRHVCRSRIRESECSDEVPIEVCCI